MGAVFDTSPDDSAPLFTGQHLGPYTLKRLIGNGGMSAVYHAVHRQTGQEVAVKVLRSELADKRGFVARLYQEARVVAQLHHPHIASFFDYGVSGSTGYLVMRLVKGQSLAQRLRDHADRRCALPTLAESAHIIRQLAGALDYAHQRDIIHCDIKPGNVMLAASGDAILVDFGIARLTAPSRTLSNGIHVAGTPTFMAPEQWCPFAPVDPATDQYALGVLAYLLLTGHPPFQENSLRGMFGHHVFSIPPAVHIFSNAIPKPVSAVLERALAKKPEDRFPTCTGFTAALDSALAPGDPDWHPPLPVAPEDAQYEPTAQIAVMLHPTHSWGHIFLSSTPTAQHDLRAIRTALQKRRLTVWYRGRDAGQPPVWDAATASAIEYAAALVVVISPDAGQSDWIAREIGYAREHNVPVIPLLVCDPTPEILPHRLTEIAPVDARAGWDMALDDLVGRLPHGTVPVTETC